MFLRFACSMLARRSRMAEFRMADVADDDGLTGQQDEALADDADAGAANDGEAADEGAGSKSSDDGSGSSSSSSEEDSGDEYTAVRG